MSSRASDQRETEPAVCSIEATMPSHPRYLQFVRAMAGEGATLAGFSDEDRSRIEIAVVEGFTNVIRHVYKNDTERPVELRLTIAAGGASGRLRIEIDDHGTYVDPSLIASRPLAEVRPGGLGVHLMKSTMDTVEYRRNAHGGTTLTLEKRRVGAAATGGDPR
jgi:anti-sigma regulatory factor (Ser/Thr protein kinase)